MPWCWPSMHSTCCGRARACAGARRQPARGMQGGGRRGEERRRLGGRRSGGRKRGGSGRTRRKLRGMRAWRLSQRRFTVRAHRETHSWRRRRGFWGACGRKTRARSARSRRLQETGGECRCGKGSTSRRRYREMRLSAGRGEVREREAECRILCHQAPLKALLGVGTHASALG